MPELNTDKCPLSGINVVEAGAGTGKTYSIQKLVLRLVLEKEVPLPKILVVTFTEAATGELMNRLHGILQLAMEAIEAVEAGQDICHHKKYDQIKEILRNLNIDRNPKERARCHRLIQKALCDYDQAAVMTIHGFCQRMLETNAFQSFFRYGVEVRPDISDIKNKIAMDFCRKTFYPADSKFANTTTSPENLLGKVDSAISNAYNGTNIIWPDANTLDVRRQFFEFYKEQLETYNGSLRN